MSFRSSEGSQHRDAEAAAAKRAAYLVLQGNGRYTVSDTGPADAFLGAAEQYLSLPGSAGNSASTPDSATLDIVGDIDVRVDCALNDWTPAANQQLLNKQVGSQRSWYLHIQTTGILRFVWSQDGGSGAGLRTAAATAATGLANGARKHIRATLDVDNGSGGWTVKFYTSDDGETWTQLGSDVTGAGVTSIFNSTTALRVGVFGDGNSEPAAGKFYRALVYSGIAGTLAADFDPTRGDAGETSFVAPTGETWTINQSGGTPAAIVGDATRVSIDSTATAHENSARLVKVGDRYRIF